MEAIIVAVVAAIPATVAALNARAAKQQTNGQLHNKLDRMETKIDDLSAWQADHIRRWHN